MKTETRDGVNPKTFEIAVEYAIPMIFNSKNFAEVTLLHTIDAGVNIEASVVIERDEIKMISFHYLGEITPFLTINPQLSLDELFSDRLNRLQQMAIKADYLAKGIL